MDYLKLFSFLSFLFVSTAHGLEWKANEWSANFGGRTTPVGAMAGVKLSKPLLLYGSDSDEKLNYGYLKPSVQLSSIGVTNQWRGQFDIFPLPFIQLGMFYQGSHRILKTNGFECETSFVCKGFFDRQAYYAKTVVGYEKAFAGIQYRYEVLKHFDSKSLLPLVDDTYVLSIQNGGDIHSFQSFFGYSLFEKSKTIIAWDQAWMEDQNSNSNNIKAINIFYLLHQIKSNESLTYSVGISAGEHVHLNRHINFIFSIDWQLTPKFGLL